MSTSDPTQEIEIACPYCGETLTIVVEADLDGELVQDCEVCCNPWLLSLARRSGALIAEVKRLDD